LAAFSLKTNGSESSKNMNRKQLEHVIRAGGDVCGDEDLVIIGSQAVLGQFPDAPEALLSSMEVDLFPRNRPERTSDIDGAIGELSPFHTTHGYYAHGVSEETASLPSGWKERLVPISTEQTRGITGWCLEVHDIAVSKLIAAREKDIQFVECLLDRKLIDLDTLAARLDTISVDSRILDRAREWLTAKR
jgi:hypothetical protein